MLCDPRVLGKPVAKLAHLSKYPGVLAGVRNKGAVEALRSRLRLAPLEIHHALTAPGYKACAVALFLARSLRVVAGLPVHRAGAVLHEKPLLTAREPAGQIGLLSEIDVVIRIMLSEIVVGRYEVHLP